MASSPLRPTTPTLAKYPIPVELITTLYRAQGAELDALIAGMTEYARARVAAYCVERERLLELGRRMAGTCGEATLIKAAGPKAGAALFAESRPVPVLEIELPAPEPVVIEPVVIESVVVEPVLVEPAGVETVSVEMVAEPPVPALRVLEFPPAPVASVSVAPAELLVGPPRPKAA